MKKKTNEKKSKLRMVAEINGKQIWSDKKGEISINNGALAFEDGSTYSVETGKTCNCGEGTIEIKIPSEDNKEEKETVIGPKSFNSRELKVSDLSAHVTIMPHSKDQIEVTLSGSEKVCRNILLSEKENILTIRSSCNTRPSSQNIFSIGESMNIQQIVSGGAFMNIRQSISIDEEGANTRITIGSCNEKRTRVDIKVPKEITISVTNVDGIVKIGDTEGTLHFASCTRYHSFIGKIKDCELESGGKGNISVERVSGIVRARLNNYGSISIDGGDLTYLTVQNNSYGNFQFDGKTAQTDLTNGGQGIILLKEASGVLSANINGRGDILINSGHLQTLDVKNNGRGDLNFKGETENSDLIANERGSIYVKKSKNRPYEKRNGRGEITVGNW